MKASPPPGSTEFLLSPQSQQMLSLSSTIKFFNAVSEEVYKVEKKSSSSIKSFECIINYQVWRRLEGALFEGERAPALSNIFSTICLDLSGLNCWEIGLNILMMDRVYGTTILERSSNHK